MCLSGMSCEINAFVWYVQNISNGKSLEDNKISKIYSDQGIVILGKTDHRSRIL